MSGTNESMIKPSTMKSAPRPSHTSVRWPRCVPLNQGIHPLAHATTSNTMTPAPPIASRVLVSRRSMSGPSMGSTTSLKNAFSPGSHIFTIMTIGRPAARAIRIAC